MKTKNYWIPDKNWPAFRSCAMGYLAMLIIVLSGVSVFGKGDVRRDGGGDGPPPPPPCECQCGCKKNGAGPFQNMLEEIKSLLGIQQEFKGF